MDTICYTYIVAIFYPGHLPNALNTNVFHVYAFKYIVCIVYKLLDFILNFLIRQYASQVLNDANFTSKKKTSFILSSQNPRTIQITT